MNYNPITIDGRISLLKGLLSSYSMGKLMQNLDFNIEYYISKNLKGTKFSAHDVI